MISVAVRNEGILSANIPVTLHFPSASKQPEIRRPRADPGETVVTTFTWRTSNYAPGIHEFRVEAPGTSRAFTAILSAPMSDFSVVEAFGPHPDAPIIQGDPVGISALVSNAGPQAGRTSVALMDASRGLVLYEDNVSLEAHESRWLDLAWKTTRYDVGAYHLMVGTDAPNDTNPGNDVADVGIATIVDDGDITVGYGGSDFASQYRDQLAKPDIGALPKFSFGEIQWTPQEPVVGEAVEITVEIRNEGIIPVTVPVTLHFPSASKQPETRRPRADPGETVVTTFTWRTNNYEPGIHEFRAEAPGTSRLFSVPLSAPMSDFSVVEAFLPNLDVPIIQGDRVEVSALVRNAGTQAGRAKVALMDASRGRVLHEDNVSLEAHESRWLELAWKTARYAVGAYRLTVETDAPNDTDPSNDVFDVGVATIVAGEDITVGYGRSDFASQYRNQLAKPDIGALPNFSFETIQWTPREPVVGEAVEITVEIRNEGTRVGNTPVTLHFPSSDKQPETRRPRIEAGSIADASFTWRTSRYAPGIHAFRVETDFGNQTFFIELLPPTVDFEVVDIYPPNSAYPIVKGDWVEVEAFVRNIGKYAGKGKITLWNLTHERPMYEDSITLEPEESSVVVFTWKTLRYEIGEHLVRVEAEAEHDTDPFNDYSDTASVNVITSRDITIGFPKKFAGPFSARRNHPPAVAADSEVSAEISVVSAHPTFAMRQQYSPSWLESGSNELAGTRPQASGPAYTRDSDRVPSPLICAQQRRLTTGWRANGSYCPGVWALVR